MPATVPSSDLRGRRTSRRARAALRLLLVAAALFGSLLAGAAPASAHAALTGSDPRSGSVVGSAPSKVALTFSEGVAMSDDAVRVLDPRGRRVDTGKPVDLGRGGVESYGVRLHAGLPDGTYTVTWKAVSADSHPVAGAFTFSVGAPSETSVAPPRENAGGGVVGALYGIGRYLAYAGFVLLVGGGAFVLACWQRGVGERAVQRLVVGGWVTLTASTFALLLLRGAYTGSGRLADVVDVAGLPDVLDTKTGTALVSRLLLLAAAALFVAVLFGTYARRVAATEPRAVGAPGTADGDAGPDGEPGPVEVPDGEPGPVEERKDLAFGLGLGGAVIAVGLAATWALAEHASTGLQPNVAMPVDVAHLLAVALWLGGLSTLLLALHRGVRIDRAAVQRFSRLAFSSVAVLALTGTYQTWRQVGSWHALGNTSYGRLVIVKVTLVLGVLALASFSRRRVARMAETGVEAGGADAAAPAENAPPEPVTVPEDPRRAAQLARQRAAVASARVRRTRDADPERGGLRRTVLAEVVIAVVVLLVTTLLTDTQPGRTEEATRGPAPASGSVLGRPATVVVPFDTGGGNGRGTARVDLTPGSAGAYTLHVRLSRPGGGPLTVPEVKASFTLPAKDLGPFPVTPERIDGDHWAAADVRLPMPGNWRMELTVRTSEIDQVTETKNVKIG